MYHNAKPLEHLDSLDKNELYDDVVEKKAMPELILKQNILIAEDNMLMSKREMLNYYRQNGVYNSELVNRFIGDMILLFDFIRDMIAELEKKSRDKRFHQLEELDNSKCIAISPRNIVLLLDLKNYLTASLHKINITNLFQRKGAGFSEKMRD
jgi:hypothetical protein